MIITASIGCKTLTERGLSRLGWPEMEAFMQKPVSKLPEAKQVRLRSLKM